MATDVLPKPAGAIRLCTRVDDDLDFVVRMLALISVTMSFLPVKCRSLSGREDWLEVVDLVEPCVAVNVALDVVPVLVALAVVSADVGCLKIGSHLLDVHCWSA